MRNIVIAMMAAAMLAGCTTTANAPRDSGVPLHETLDRIKSELRAVRRVMNNNPDDFVLSCAGNVQPGSIEFSAITVQLGISDTNRRSLNGGLDIGAGSGLSLGANVSQSTSDGRSLTVSMRPTDIPVGSEADRVRPGGIAESVLGMMRELSQVNDTEPCLDLAPVDIPAAVLRLSFTVDRFREGSGGLSLLLLRVGGGTSEANSVSNTITLQMRVDGMTL